MRIKTTHDAAITMSEFRRWVAHEVGAGAPAELTITFRGPEQDPADALRFDRIDVHWENERERRTRVDSPSARANHNK